MSWGFENLIRDRKCFYGLKIKTHILSFCRRPIAQQSRKMHGEQNGEMIYFPVTEAHTVVVFAYYS